MSQLLKPLLLRQPSKKAQKLYTLHLWYVPNNRLKYGLSRYVECPIDQKRIDLRRYTAKAFEINHQLLDQIEKVVESPKKVRVPLAKEMSPKKEF